MPEPGAAERARTPLLDLVSAQALDEDYLAAARRRGPGQPPPRGGRGRTAVVTAVTVAVFGLLLAAALAQTRQDADVRDASRAGLISRIEDGRARVAAEQERAAELRTRTTDAEAFAAEQTQDLDAETLRGSQLATVTGFVAVSGEGVRATLDQAPDAGPTQQVRDSDLALLVNALWSAGAEAVSVNGQRLTALSAIRTSGRAVEVNGVGVAPPFTVLAIGDRSRLQADFYDTSSGLAFSDLTAQFDLEFELENATSLQLPAAPNRLQRLRSATPTSPATSPRPQEERP